MGNRSVFTDHSLFEFSYAVYMLINELLEGMLSHVDAAICVSLTGYLRPHTRISTQS